MVADTKEVKPSKLDNNGSYCWAAHAPYTVSLNKTSVADSSYGSHKVYEWVHRLVLYCEPIHGIASSPEGIAESWSSFSRAGKTARGELEITLPTSTYLPAISIFQE